MVELEPQRAALVAVGQASDANASLIRFLLEGPFNDQAPFEDDVEAYRQAGGAAIAAVEAKEAEERGR